MDLDQTPEFKRAVSLASMLSWAVRIWRTWSFFVCAGAIYGAFFRSPEWVIGKVAPLSNIAAGVCVVFLPLFLALLIWRISRPVGAIGVYLCSSFVLTAIWVVLLATLKSMWGTAGTIIGLLLLGWGVIPTSLLAQLIAGHYATACLLGAVSLILGALKFTGVVLVTREFESLAISAEGSLEECEKL